MMNPNLVDDSFIQVLDLDGNESVISLQEALINAHKYKAICGECLPQDKAIERLLRGILHRILQDYGANGEKEPLTSPKQARNRWVELWKNGQFPAQPILDYFNTYKDRFNLVDDTHPFFQVHETEKQIEFKASNGKIAKGDGVNPRTVGKLVGTLFASSSRPRVWADRYFDENSTLSWQEGARWLLFINSFDDASFKKPPTDIHVSFCGQITGIYAEGANLFETLMLNLPLSQLDQLWKNNTPYWEIEPFTRSQMVVAPPDNPSLLLTFPYRRMHLIFNEEGRVTGYELTGHHSFPTDNYLVEQNGVYRAPDLKKGTPLGFRRLTSDFLWKNYGDLFLPGEDQNLRPGIINWISNIVNSDDYEISIPELKFRSVEVSYKSMQCVFSEMTDDTLVMNSFLLADDSADWRILINSSVENLKKAAQATGYFFKNLAIAGGGDPQKDYPRKEGEEIFWQRIDTPFREWLGSLKEMDEIIEREKEVKTLVYGIADQIRREKEASASLKAAIGTTQKVKKGKTEVEVTYNLQKACGQYYSQIRKIMGDSPKHAKE